MAEDWSWLRLCPSASISSRNRTHGALRRAASKISCRFFSELPIHMFSTSTMDSGMNLAPISPATARARNVLPQPGGPYSSSPPRRLLPYIARSCGLRSGPRKASSSRCLTAAIPPTSASRIGELSTSKVRSASPSTGSASSPARAKRGGITSESCSSYARQSISRSTAGSGRGAGAGSGLGAPIARAIRSRAAALSGAYCNACAAWLIASCWRPASRSRPARCNRSGTSSGRDATAAVRLSISAESLIRPPRYAERPDEARTGCVSGSLAGARSLREIMPSVAESTPRLPFVCLM